LLANGNGFVAVPPGRLPDVSSSSELLVVAAGYLGEAWHSIVDRVAPRRVRRSQSEPPVEVWEGHDPGFSGQSGGPLVNHLGQLIGIRSGAADGKGYYSHSRAIHGFLQRNKLEWICENSPFDDALPQKD
jgi:hypothetical protein